MFWNKKVATKIKNDRLWKELLRENLNTVAIDMFYGDDPTVLLSGTERNLYLKKFYDIMNDKDVMGRIVYLVNKQANLTLKSMKEGRDESDMAAAMNINGLCLLKDEIERLGKMYQKENVPEEDFNRYSVV